MDMSNKTPVLLFLFICINFLSGLNVSKPRDLAVNISDGEVMVHWKRPVEAPPNFKYNVQMAKLHAQWTKVESCTGILDSFCDLSNFIEEYNCVYKVRVQLVAGDVNSTWIFMKVRPNEGELQHPAFTLLATSSTLSVFVHEKPILRKLFPLGVKYSIYLEEKGQADKTIIAFLRNEAASDPLPKIFRSLHWGREYCVSMKVESVGALPASSISPKQCLQLPEQEWYIIAVSSLAILGMLTIFAITATIILCYLSHPEKTPVALKSPASSWQPLSVGEGIMEVVTDKGWFLSSYRTEEKNCTSIPVTNFVVTEENGKEDKRKLIMDSGVSMMSNSATNNEQSPLTRQEDSGCGSLGGPESSTSSHTDYPVEDEKTDTVTVQKKADSGLGLGCQLDSSSMNLDGQDSRLLQEPVPQGNYRTQRPCAVQLRVCDDKQAFQQILPETVLAKVFTDYKARPQSCICSGAGECTWCRKQGHCGSEVIKQYRPIFIEKRQFSSDCHFVDSFKAEQSYSKKIQMDTVMVDDFKKPFTQLGETSSLLTTLSTLPLLEERHDFNMNSVSLSLWDIQMTTDD